MGGLLDLQRDERPRAGRASKERGGSGDKPWFEALLEFLEVIS
jgi:hypothetical protein